MKMDDQDEMLIDSDPEIKSGSDTKASACMEQGIPGTGMSDEPLSTL